MITKAERTELRSVVRQQFHVLKMEVEQRRAELLADIDQQITERFAAEDKDYSDASHVAYEAVMEANRKINDLIRGLTGNHRERMYVEGGLPPQGKQKRYEMRSIAALQIEASVKAAHLKLQRQEADLLRNLSVGAIESEEARQFLTGIPTAGELVPVARLAELEASLHADGDDS